MIPPQQIGEFDSVAGTGADCLPQFRLLKAEDPYGPESLSELELESYAKLYLERRGAKGAASKVVSIGILDPSKIDVGGGRIE